MRVAWGDRVNRFPPRFLELLAVSAGPVLDCGAGGRARPGVVSIDIVSHPNHDVQADALALPFPADTFDLVLSQAVIEHVTNPQRYADEIVRVLRPGGHVYVEGAFLQPVHQAPAHFFNVTGFGLAHVFRSLEILEQGTVGDFAEMVAWICREAGVPVPTLEVPAMSDMQRWNTASGVTLLGRKP